MDTKVEALENGISSLSKELKEVIELISSGFQKTESNFDSIKKEIDNLHSKLDNLKGSTSKGFDHVGLKLENLTEEINKIGIVTRYDDEYKNLSIVK